ncbi:MAG: ribosome small subunit-dependent GTPase A [Bacteriovoracaceae bacterium]|nr:ribosome small subunit-dependent GTPase A [Bacteriovoracaceae bacterium]
MSNKDIKVEDNFQILKSSRNTFFCESTAGKIVEAIAFGKLLKSETLVPGDIVKIQYEQDRPMITELLVRNNSVFRFLPRDRKKKAIASNIDLMAIVLSCERPEFKRGLLERYLIRSAQWEIPAILILTKLDLVSPSVDLTWEMERTSHLIEKFFVISSVQTNLQSPWTNSYTIKDLMEYLESKMVLFMGPSGVGKTKLISILSEGKYDLKSNELGKSGKGTHTTTWAEIIRFSKFSLMDSPGIRSFSLNDLNSEELINYFPDILEISNKCKFSNCEHTENTPGCAIQSKMLPKNNSEGDKQIRIFQSRFESYQKICHELKIDTEKN